MSPKNRAADPCHFVLLFPGGQEGWHPGLRDANGDKISPTQYYKYYTYERRRHPSQIAGANWDDSIFRAGRLAQEWWCSCWIKAEEHRLDFLASAAGQAQIKADTYSALKRHVQGLDADTSVGRVVLPNTHRGSRRRMATAYQDGNCLVHHYGSPDIFFTATANANAPEVLRHF
jgi:hypothetical protein